MRLLVIVALAALGVLCPATGLAKPSIESALDQVKPEAGANKDVALIVAIEDYDKVPDIQGARANARLWRQWFRARGTRDVRVVEDTDASHGWGRDGKPHGLLPKVEAAAAQARRKGGTLWFVFIGHGAPVTENGKAQGVLLAHGVQQTAQSLRTHGIFVDADLMPRLAKARKSIAILDACFSGQSGSGSLVPGLQPLIPAAFSTSRAVTVFTAAKGTEFAGPLPKSRRPAFSYLMLGALAGFADGEVDRKRDRRVTSEEAFEWVKLQMARLIHGRRQTPTMRGPLRALSRAWVALDPVPAVTSIHPQAKPATVPKSSSSPRWARSTDELDAQVYTIAREFTGSLMKRRPKIFVARVVDNNSSGTPRARWLLPRLRHQFESAGARPMIVREWDGDAIPRGVDAVVMATLEDRDFKGDPAVNLVIDMLHPVGRATALRTGGPITFSAAIAPSRAVKSAPKLPTKLSNREIMDVIRRRQNWVGDCRYKHNALQGSTIVTIVINNNGKVESAKAGGKFAGTATGKCVEERVRTFTFSGFAGPSMTIRMPFQL